MYDAHMSEQKETLLGNYIIQEVLSSPSLNDELFVQVIFILIALLSVIAPPNIGNTECWGKICSCVFCMRISSLISACVYQLSVEAWKTRRAALSPSRSVIMLRRLTQRIILSRECEHLCLPIQVKSKNPSHLSHWKITLCSFIHPPLWMIMTQHLGMHYNPILVK